MVHDLFHMGVPFQEKLIRSIAVYVFLVVAIRVFGRRELGQLTAFDMIVLLTISNILQNAMIGNDNSLVGGLLGAVVVLSANLVLAYVVFKRRAVERAIEGDPKILVRNGELQWKAMASELLTEQDVLSAIRRQGLEHIDQVKLAIVEPNGLISVVAAAGGESGSN